VSSFFFLAVNYNMRDNFLPGGGGGLPGGGIPEIPNPFDGLSKMFSGVGGSLAYAANIAIIVVALIIGLIVLLLVIKIIKAIMR
jgi:hypothetical protein